MFVFVDRARRLFGESAGIQSDVFLASFQVNLAEVIAVQWLDKRGTAIVCLTLAKEGRLLIKTSMDLHGWFEDLQVS